MGERVECHADLFASLGNETRLSILMALDEVSGGAPASYVDLMRGADLDDSGKFNYHLQQLLGQFVQKEGDHYVPTPAGIMLIRSINAGQYDRQWDHLGTVSLGTPCEVCGTDRIVVHEGMIALRCPNCRDTLCWATMVPSAFERRDDSAIRHAIDTSVKGTHRDMIADVCPWCGGTTTVWCSDETRLPVSIRSRDRLVFYQCDVCHGLSYSSIGQYLQSHPTVVDYCDEHEIDFPDQRLWAVPSAVTDRTTHVRSRDPLVIEKYVTVDGCRLFAIVDGDGTVSYADHIRLSDT